MTPRFDLLAQLRAEWRLKVLLTLILNPWVLVPYLWIQRHPLFGAYCMPESALDRWVPFRPEAVWFYLSINLLLPVAPLLMDEPGALKRYGVGMGLIGGISNLVFLFWPTFCLRPELTESTSLYARLVQIDTPYNAMPSLHAALAIFSALCCESFISRLTRPRLARGPLCLWVAAILWAVMATKQHVFLDLLAGSILGVSTYVLVFCGSRLRVQTRVLQRMRKENEIEEYLSVSRS